MAAIDFPASPVDQQVFVAGNGIAYVWKASPGLWLVQSGPVTGALGDVMAVNGTFTNTNGAANPITTYSVQAGNVGGFFNAANGRFTPPAGKYFLTCTCSIQAPSGGNGTASLAIQKNGAAIINSPSGSGSALFAIPLSLGAYVDANGTDFFNFAVIPLAAAMSSQVNAMFAAFPISGVQGPPGAFAFVTRIQKFPANGTYTPHINMVNGYAVGIAGGGAAGGFAGSAGFTQASGGGASGNQVTSFFTRAQVVAGIAVTIGPGGTPVVGATGNPGGDTIFGSLLTSKGGGGGAQYTGGLPNTVGNIGDLIELGFVGGNGFQVQVASGTVAIGGLGGGRGGGPGGVIGSTGAVAGSAGQPNTGGGGGGTAQVNTTGSMNAVGGGSGFLYVVENCTA